mgnify:CR=1 FL=1
MQLATGRQNLGTQMARRNRFAWGDLNKSTKNRKWLDYWHLRNRRYFAPLNTFAIMWTYLGAINRNPPKEMTF